MQQQRVGVFFFLLSDAAVDTRHCCVHKICRDNVCTGMNLPLTFGALKGYSAGNSISRLKHPPLKGVSSCNQPRGEKKKKKIKYYKVYYTKHILYTRSIIYFRQQYIHIYDMDPETQENTQVYNISIDEKYLVPGVKQRTQK